jgi:sulfur transfer protein SufE
VCPIANQTETNLLRSKTDRNEIPKQLKKKNPNRRGCSSQPWRMHTLQEAQDEIRFQVWQERESSGEQGCVGFLVMERGIFLGRRG